MTARMSLLAVMAILAVGVGAGRGAASQQEVIVVVGAGGTPEFASEFAQWAGLWEQACDTSEVNFTAIGVTEDRETSDRNRLEEALVSRAGTSTPAALWLVLIGHGTFDGREAKFNLRGPDVSASDLAKWLSPLECPVAAINTASSSAPFLKELSGPGRAVITATKSGFEHNYARFGRFLAESIVEPEADLDKDGQTSLLEAFLMASSRVGEFYKANGRLATEHALLDDNGDTLGTPADWFRGIRPVKRARDGAALDGYRAHQFCLRYSDLEAQMPADVRAQRDRLELQVLRLRDGKADMDPEAYYNQMESLLRDIAVIYERAESESPSVTD